MESTTILNIILIIISIDYFLNLYIGLLNYRSFDNPIPKNLQGVYDKIEYSKSQLYNKTTFRFSLITSTISFIILFYVFKYGLLGELDSFLRSYTLENELSLSLLFFGSIFFINDFISLKFCYRSII